MDGWTEKQLEQHMVDTGEELRINKIIAISKVESLLQDLGVSGENHCPEEKIKEEGNRDNDYRTTRLLIEAGKAKHVVGEYKNIAKQKKRAS